MSCAQTLTGIAKDCEPNMGGIVEVYLANKTDVSAIQVTDGQVKGITMSTSAKMKLYSFRRQSGSLTSTYTIDQTTGVNFVTTELFMPFNRMETAKRVEVSAMAVGELVALVKDANGKYWYLGNDGPLMASAAVGRTGTKTADKNSYDVTLSCESKEMPYEVLVGEGGVDLSSITD